MLKRLLPLLLFASCAFAQYPFHPQRVTAEPIPKVTVPQGGKAKVEMMFRVTPGFHINSNKPSSELYIPTVLRFDVPTDISIAGVHYPKGELMSLPFDPENKLSVYTGDITVRGLVMAAKSTPHGTYRVHGNLRYQACDNRACYPPSTVPISFDVQVQRAHSGHTRHNPAQSPHVHN